MFDQNCSKRCCLAMDIVNEYLSSLMKCLYQIGECMFDQNCSKRCRLAMDRDNEYLSSLVKCLHQIGECMLIIIPTSLESYLMLALPGQGYTGYSFFYTIVQLYGTAVDDCDSNQDEHTTRKKLSYLCILRPNKKKTGQQQTGSWTNILAHITT